MTAASSSNVLLTLLTLLTVLLSALPSTALAAALPDPAGDAVGNGSLALPTAPVYRRNAFDLLSVEVQDAPTLALDVTMASLDNPWRLPNGFSLPIIEIYLDTAEGAGQTELLYGEAGSRMSLPAGVAWDYAFYITGDAFRVFSGETGEPVDVTEEVGATLAREGNTLHLATRLPHPARAGLYAGVYAVVGSYDPLTESGWRPVTQTPSPGTLSSPTQVVRAVDVLADTLEAQESAINSGVLPRPARRATPNSGWLLLSAAGLLLSLVGIGLRVWMRAPRNSASTSVLLTDPSTDEQEVGHDAAPRDPVLRNPVFQTAVQDTARRDTVLQAAPEHTSSKAIPKEHTPQRYTTVTMEMPDPPVTPRPVSPASSPAPAKSIPVLELPLYTPTIVGASEQPGTRTPTGAPETPKTSGTPEKGLEDRPALSEAPPAAPTVPSPPPAAAHSPVPTEDVAPSDHLSTFSGALDEPPDSDWRIWSGTPDVSKTRHDESVKKG